MTDRTFDREAVREIIWSVTGCSDSLAGQAADAIMDRFESCIEVTTLNDAAPRFMTLAEVRAAMKAPQ